MKEERFLIDLGATALLRWRSSARGETAAVPPADARAANLNSRWSAALEGEYAWTAYHATNTLEIAQGDGLSLAEAEHLIVVGVDTSITIGYTNCAVTTKRNNRMPSMKTAISLPEKLFAESSELAEQLEISRSRLVALALQEFIQRHRNRRTLKDLNLALVDLENEDDDLSLLARAAERLKDVEW